MRCVNPFQWMAYARHLSDLRGGGRGGSQAGETSQLLLEVVEAAMEASNRDEDVSREAALGSRLVAAAPAGVDKHSGSPSTSSSHSGGAARAISKASVQYEVEAVLAEVLPGAAMGPEESIMSTGESV